MNKGTLEPGVKVSKDLSPVVNAFLVQGYDVLKGQNSHIIIRPTQERRDWLSANEFDVESMDSQTVFPSSPSDWRSVINSVKDAEKYIGFNYAPSAWTDPDRLPSHRVAAVLEACGEDGATPWEVSKLTDLPEKDVRPILNGLGKQNGKRKPPGRTQSQTVYVLKHIDTPKISAESLFEKPDGPSLEETTDSPEPTPEIPAVEETTDSPEPTPEITQDKSLEDLTELVDMILDMPVSLLESKDCRAQVERLLPLTAALIVAENLNS